MKNDDTDFTDNDKHLINSLLDGASKQQITSLEDKEQEQTYQEKIKKLKAKHWNQSNNNQQSANLIQHMNGNLKLRIKRMELGDLSANIRNHSVNYTLYALKEWCYKFPEEKKYYSRGVKKNRIYSMKSLEKYYLDKIQKYNSNPQFMKIYMNALEKLYQQSKLGIKFYFKYQGVLKPLSKAQLLLFILSSFR